MMKIIKKWVNTALFATGIIMVAILVAAESYFGVLSSVNVALVDLPVDPMISLLALMGVFTVILMSLFSVALSRKMKMKIK